MIYVRCLIWDDWNVAHIARHGVVPHEVEESCACSHIVRQSYNDRLVVVGPILAGRMLAVVLAEERQDAYYVVTARPADRKERRRYRAAMGQGGGPDDPTG